MHLKTILALCALCGSLLLPLRAADNAQDTLRSKLAAVVENVRAKLNQPDISESTLADELKQLDALVQEYKSEQTDEAAQILVVKGTIYLQVLEDFDKAGDVFLQLKKDFPNSSQAQQVDRILEMVDKQKAAAAAQAALAEGKMFPDFAEKDLNGNDISVGKYRGKVVLLDFWATWCGPCVQEMPNVIAAYKKFQPRGFEVIGISLDRDEAALKNYLEKNGIAWPQIFDGKFWDSKLANQYGVTAIPFTLLIDGEGRIVGRNLRGAALEQALVKLLGE
jgi:Peroxiredoxin